TNRQSPRRSRVPRNRRLTAERPNTFNPRQCEISGLDSLFKLGVGLADQYFRQEGDRQVRRATPDQGHATHYSASDVRAWQKKLNFLGYDAGPPDGVFGERTKRAIAAYQRSIGAPVTGILTPL